MDGWKKAVLFGLLVFLAAGMAGCGKIEQKQQEERTVRGMFSWNYKDIGKDRHKDTLLILDQLNINELYQDISEDLEEDEEDEFLEKAHEQQIDVYALFGDADWVMSKQEEMWETLNWFIGRNGKHKEKWDGVMLDIEPYLLEEWEEDPDEVMKNYLEVLRKARHRLAEAGLPMLLCIPYYYDDLGYGEELEMLVAELSSGIAVMNYNKADEAGQIRREAELAFQYGKKCISVYELQPPGEYHLEEENTYYHQGIEGVEDSWKSLEKVFTSRKLGMAFHYLNTIKEMMDFA